MIQELLFIVRFCAAFIAFFRKRILLHSIILHQNHLMSGEISSNKQVCLFKVFKEVLVDSLRNSWCRVISILTLIRLSVSSVIVVWISLLLRLIVVANRGIEVSLLPICSLWPRTVSCKILIVSSCTWRHWNCHSWYTSYLRFADIVSSMGKTSITISTNSVSLAQSLIIVVIVCCCHPEHTCRVLLLLLLTVLADWCARLYLLWRACTTPWSYIV